MKRLSAPGIGRLLAELVIVIGSTLAVFAILLATDAHAQMDGPSPASSAGPGQYAVSLTAVTSLTVPLGALSAQICVEGAPARYIDDGSTPSATIGIPVAAGQCFAYGGPLAAMRFIGSGATLDVSFYR